MAKIFGKRVAMLIVAIVGAGRDSAENGNDK
jgi:hypothetical protein